MKHKRFILLVVLILASCAAPEEPADAPEPTVVQPSSPMPTPLSEAPKILFANSSSTEIYSIDIKGENLRWLTEGAPEARDPVWSPDGTRFAYVSFPDVPNSYGEIVISDPNGNRSPIYNVTWTGGGGGGGVRGLCWNSDGSGLYYSWGGSLYQINAAGAGEPEVLAVGEEFVWTPDKSKVAFSQLISDDTIPSRKIEIYAKPLNSKQEISLWVSDEDTVRPQLRYMEWSHDGEMLALLVHYKSADTMKLYVVDNEGGVLVDRPLFNLPFEGEEWNIDAHLLLRADWSPDGTMLAFVDSNEIYLWDPSNADPEKIGSDFSNLTRTDFTYERFPVWSPDGTRIAYLTYTSSLQDSSPVLDLLVMNQDGSRQTRMTVDAYLEMGSSAMRVDGMIDINAPLFLDWSPDSKQMVYSSLGEPVLDCTTYDCVQALSNAGIYLLDVASSESRYLTNPDVGGINPIWQPQP